MGNGGGVLCCFCGTFGFDWGFILGGGAIENDTGVSTIVLGLRGGASFNNKTVVIVSKTPPIENKKEKKCFILLLIANFLSLVLASLIGRVLCAYTQA